MAVYLSPNGRELLTKQLAKCERELEEIREEKNIAYTLSGDTWHDNPGFNQLEQAEARKCQDIAAINEMLSSALICTYDNRCVTSVKIGSIVRCSVEWTDDPAGKVDEKIFEIVGFGEGDPAQNRITYDSPMGKALLHHEPGEQVSSVIAGKPVEIEVVALFPSWEDARKAS